MNITLLHDRTHHAKKDNQLTEDIAAIVAQQLDELEQTADAPSELSIKYGKIYAQEKGTDNLPNLTKNNREEDLAYNQEKQIENALREATHQKTSSDIKNHSTSMQKFLQSWFRSNLILLIAESLHTTVLRPVPVISASFLSLVGSFALLVLSLSNGSSLNISTITVIFVVGYIIGLCIDVIKLRSAHANQ